MIKEVGPYLMFITRGEYGIDDEPNLPFPQTAVLLLFL